MGLKNHLDPMDIHGVNAYCFASAVSDRYPQKDGPSNQVWGHENGSIEFRVVDSGSIESDRLPM